MIASVYLTFFAISRLPHERRFQRGVVILPLFKAVKLIPWCPAAMRPAPVFRVPFEELVPPVERVSPGVQPSGGFVVVEERLGIRPEILKKTELFNIAERGREGSVIFIIYNNYILTLIIYIYININISIRFFWVFRKTVRFL